MAPQDISPFWFDSPEAMFNIVAQNINAAYNAYANLTAQLGTTTDQTAAEAIPVIQNLNPQLTNINPIFVVDANTPSISLGLVSPLEKGLAHTFIKAGLPETPTGHARIGEPEGWITTYVLFGFAATYTDSNNNSVNVFVYRGTANATDTYYDIKGWGTNTDCLLPTVGTQNTYGQVQSELFSFYNSALSGTTLAASTIAAVTAVTKANPASPWVTGAHSLGGAIMTVAMLDLVVSNVLDPSRVLTFNYGCLRIGNADFVKQYNALTKNATVCVQNLCDFVPTFSGLLPPDANAPKYEAVGQTVTFIWETGETWGNHSMANVYMPMVDPKNQFFVMLKPIPTVFPIPV